MNKSNLFRFNISFNSFFKSIFIWCLSLSFQLFLVTWTCKFVARIQQFIHFPKRTATSAYFSAISSSIIKEMTIAPHYKTLDSLFTIRICRLKKLFPCGYQFMNRIAHGRKLFFVFRHHVTRIHLYIVM